MSSSMKVFAAGVLRVTVQYVYYPVTEEVLHQVFEPYGVVQISVSQRVDHVEAEVHLRSRDGATQALALHGRCIYEGCCLLDIQDVSPVAPPAKSDMAELCDQIHDQLLKLSAMMCTISSSTSSSSSEITTEELGLEHEHSHNDIYPKIAAPLVCGANQGVIATDHSSLAAPTATTCSMVCPSSDATIDVFPKIGASAESDEDLNLGTVSVATLSPASYSTGDLTHGHDGDNPAVVSVVLWTVTPSSTTCPHSSPDKNFYVRSVLRPLPWPSFPCDGDGKRLTYSMVMISSLLKLSHPSMVVSALAREIQRVGEIQRKGGANSEFCFHSWQCSGFSPGSTLTKHGYILHCSRTAPSLLTSNWNVIQRLSLGNLKLLTCARSVHDNMPPWRRGGFSPGTRVCNYFLGALVMFALTEWKMEMSSHGKILSTPESWLTSQGGSLHITKIWFAALELFWLSKVQPPWPRPGTGILLFVTRHAVKLTELKPWPYAHIHGEVRAGKEW